jgi:hypothetical protein
LKSTINISFPIIIVCVKGYRYSFNGQERDDEIAGAGNIMTAEFWEYDTRLGRRFNIDPRHFAWESPYSVMGDNPIVNSDIKGDKWKNGHEKEKKDAEGKVKESQENLDNKQKNFNDKYKDVDPTSLKGKLRKEYKSDLKEVDKARDKLSGAMYELDLATTKYNAADLVIQEFSKQAPDAYNYWENYKIGDKDVEINVSVTNLPVPSGDLESTTYNPNYPQGGASVLLRVSPEYKVDKIQLNVEVMAHGLGHAWSDWHNAIRNGSENNANLYARIILNGIKGDKNPKHFIEQFEK